MHDLKTKLLYLYFVGIASTVGLECVNDPCHIGTYCAPDGILSANPNDCSAYLLCQFGQWVEMPCGTGLLFDHDNCSCTIDYLATCLVCPTTVSQPTQAPGTCEPVPDPCPTPGERYADQSSCEHFYECLGNGSLGYIKCETPIHQCNTAGYPCLYDIYSKECLHPYSGFDCNPRCLAYTTEHFKTTDESHTYTEQPSTDSIVTTSVRVTTEERHTTGDTTRVTTAVTTPRQYTTTVPLLCEEDPCDRSEYCHLADMKAGNPDDCSTYYQCVYGTWQVRACAAGLVFNPTHCFCDYEYLVDCLECPRTTPRPTLAPGLCPGTPSPCVPGEHYADVSDCEYFYVCEDDHSLARHQCISPMHQCVTSGYACVYDIYHSACMHPYDDFDCQQRCVDEIKAGEQDLMGVRSPVEKERGAMIKPRGHFMDVQGPLEKERGAMIEPREHLMGVRSPVEKARGAMIEPSINNIPQEQAGEKKTRIVKQGRLWKKYGQEKMRRSKRLKSTMKTDENVMKLFKGYM